MNEAPKKKDFITIEVQRYETIITLLDKLHNALVSTDFKDEKKKDFTERYILLRKETGQLKHLFDLFKYKIKTEQRNSIEEQFQDINTRFKTAGIIIGKGKVFRLDPEITEKVIDLYSKLNWNIQLVR